jgi:hypothetical protein
MEQAAERWQIAIRRWWPESGNPEDAEPPLPHDTFFDRELPLYVDWDYWAKTWVVPNQSTNVLKFDNTHWPSELDRFRAELQVIKGTATKGLLSSEALTLVNSVYSGTYINQSTPNATIQRLDDELTALIAAKLDVSATDIQSSPLSALALYHFATLPPDAA